MSGAMEAFGVLMVLGVRVREVKQLREGHIWMPRRKLLLIDADLDAQERDEVADLFLPDVLAATSSTPENA